MSQCVTSGGQGPPGPLAQDILDNPLRAEIPRVGRKFRACPVRLSDIDIWQPLQGRLRAEPAREGAQRAVCELRLIYVKSRLAMQTNILIHGNVKAVARGLLLRWLEPVVSSVPVAIVVLCMCIYATGG